MITHPAPEKDRMAILLASLEESGNTNFVPITEPLPKERRQHLYSVPDDHDLGKMYGVSQLSAILSQTKTPHLADYDPSSSRRGLRYIDNAQPIPEKLTPFTGDEARIAWRTLTQETQKEMGALAQAAQNAKNLTAAQMKELFPDPEVEAESLKTADKKPISRSSQER